MRWSCGLAIAVTLSVAAAASDFRATVEADWLLQEQYRHAPQASTVTTQIDAAGACDGVKSGEWGFHTDVDDPPWWQVDLEAAQAIREIAIWNRCDGVASRCRNLIVQVSDDSAAWQTVYQHDGATFYGFTDGKPLRVTPCGEGGGPVTARFVRIEVPEKTYFHLDEVEVFGPDDPSTNLALHRPADQSSTSQWSTDSRPAQPVHWAQRVPDILANCARLSRELADAGMDVRASLEETGALAARLAAGTPGEADAKALFFEARWLQRRLMLAHPLLDFDAIFFAKRVPGSFNHMSDQYYGWWSRPGGGLFILRGFKEDAPECECISDSFDTPGSFLRPILSYDAEKVLFAWCRYYPDLAAQPDKLNKDNVPEDAFYHLFEMRRDNRTPRRVTRGKYDDFDGRYLPDDRIVFLSTRRGQAVQCGIRSAMETIAHDALPDCYVRCGGGPERPVAVYTLHTMDADGSDLCAISPFEMFEWTPSVGRDGTILYSRWDYVDRHNMPYMSLWAINPDGTNARIVYGNFTQAPHCTFEPRCVPNSNKIVFTASGHHAQTLGSLVLLDPAKSSEGTSPITRLTPEVVFPEIEGWPKACFANPWPLSESLYLVAWGCEATPRQGQSRAAHAMGLYLLDTDGDMELLYRDPEISSQWPMPLRPQPRPPVIASTLRRDGPNEGRFLLADVYAGLNATVRGNVKALRIVAVPAKTHPTMNFPSLGLTNDDPGKCVLGTVPVEADGSAFFRVPAGVIVFFQALDERGMAIQTMRSATHVQPGQTLSCIGCHENRHLAPPAKQLLAAQRPPSNLRVGPEGSWPLRFDRLVQPVLNDRCIRCHAPDARGPDAAKLDLTEAKAYDSLVDYGSPSLRQHVQGQYAQGFSTEGRCAAQTSPLLALLTAPEGHYGERLDPQDQERLVTWIDTYGQRLGSFSEDQDRRLVQLREEHREVFEEHMPDSEDSDDTGPA
ncbi:MAG TPA: discoidin domain-containing protein [Candidatus Hydrogenedentes bacterium]|nr:discoidin domain-containing protein [Candidatus Hydrogenedentota bacterium]HPG69328.1 discoidin domain-containing protein [Candidatus Hydrogenedentota bacterium]